MTTYIPALTIPHQIFASPAASILLPIVLGSGVGIAVSSKITKETYLALRQPPLSPPTWIFGPAWTLLYGTMGYAAYRATNVGLSTFSSVETIATTKQAATLYTIQLALNLAWTPLFFGAKKPVAASVDILALLGASGYLTYLWGSVDEVSGYLMAPYLAWLGFATYLCVGIGYLNDWDLKPKDLSKSA